MQANTPQSVTEEGENVERNGTRSIKVGAAGPRQGDRRGGRAGPGGCPGQFYRHAAAGRGGRRSAGQGGCVYLQLLRHAGR